MTAIERVHNCVMWLMITSGIIGTLGMLALVLYDDKEWMWCVIVLLLIVGMSFIIAYLGDKYSEYMMEVDE